LAPTVGGLIGCLKDKQEWQEPWVGVDQDKGKQWHISLVLPRSEKLQGTSSDFAMIRVKWPKWVFW